ncbi:MAG: helix-turn-helix domain-containing protein [Pseudomonadota bacterium]
MSDAPPLVVAVLYRGMNLFELGVVAEVFGAARPDFPTPLFRLRFAQAEPGELQAESNLRLLAAGGLPLLRQADIVIVPGWRDPASAAPPPLLRALAAAHARGAKVVSICAGAFVLAAAGLLDGKRATTHWRYAQDFRRRFPAVALDPDVLYLDEDGVMTSAGSAAGIDACLQIVRAYYGVEVANTVARAMVTNPHRSGGQAQYIRQPFAERAGRSLAPLLEWARGHLAQPITVAVLAKRAAMSERTLLRKFLAEAGTTPKAWLQHERIRAAQGLLEGTDAPLERVAESVGFSTMAAFRSAFRQAAGVAPSHYRERFRT